METPGQAIDHRDLAILANKKKVTKMLFIVVLLFGICWFPFQMFNVLASLSVPLRCGRLVLSVNMMSASLREQRTE